MKMGAQSSVTGAWVARERLGKLLAIRDALHRWE
jgi:hypothetical protein